VLTAAGTSNPPAEDQVHAEGSASEPERLWADILPVSRPESESNPDPVGGHRGVRPGSTPGLAVGHRLRA